MQRVAGEPRAHRPLALTCSLDSCACTLRVTLRCTQDPTVAREQLFEALQTIESLGDAKQMNPKLLDGLKLLQSYQTIAGEDSYGTDEAVRLYSFLREHAVEDYPELDTSKKE